jgi:choloylglycine hydrolase
MATVSNGYPLYYEATNEMGLSLAGLNFPGNAIYHPETAGKDNIAPFELIPWVLGQCATVPEALEKLKHVNLWEHPFSAAFPPSPLHWLLSDQESSFTLEPLAEGLKISPNPVGVLTNNPPFDYHLENLKHYTHLSPNEPNKSQWTNAKPASFGTGAIGLPGDFSSASRFIRAAFIKSNAVFGDQDEENIMQFFHVLQSVQQVKGAVRHDGANHITVYSSCCNATKGVYYYNTYNNIQPTGISMHKADLNSSKLISYPLRNKANILMEN